MRTFLLLIWVWLFPAAGWAQSHFFANISRSGGLASSDVYGICQDSSGFYWIATDNGLQRFDGERFINLGSETSHPFLSRSVYQVINQGSQLFLKFEEEYGVFNTSSFKYSPVGVQAANHKAGTYLWKDNSGTIYLVGGNILAYDKAKNSFARSSIKYPSNFTPRTIFEDTLNHHYWIGGDQGIIVYDAKTGIVYTNENNPLRLPLIGDERFKEVTSIFIDKKRDYWIVYGGISQHYACYNSTGNKYIPEAGNLRSYYKGAFSISGFYETADGQLWLFGKNALFNYMSKENIFYNTKAGMSLPAAPKFGDVRQMMEDKENGVWIVTDRGLYMFYVNLPVVKTIVFKTENDDNNITSAVQLPNDEIWMSSHGKGLIALKENKRLDIKSIFNSIPAAYQPSAKNANIICKHSLIGKLWLGCENGTLVVVDPVSKSLDMLQPSAFAGSSITAITENVAGNLFFGTNTGKIITGERDFRQIANLNTDVNFLYADKNDRLWVCTEGEGLLLLNAPTGKISARYDKKWGLSSNRALKIVQVNDSIFAVASNVLNIINISSGSVKQFSHLDGLSGNTIKTIELDNKGHLWVSTSNGVCKFNFNRQRFASYDEKDGFIAFENAGTSSSVLNNGNILLAGNNVLVSFPPDMYGNAGQPPQVKITDIRVADKFLPVDSLLKTRELSFADNNNSISIFFSSMSYLLNDKLTYYYKLPGVNKDWVAASSQASAVYTMLPPGKYVFYVKCENEEGLSSGITSFNFRIRPPFWQT